MGGLDGHAQEVFLHVDDTTTISVKLFHLNQPGGTRNHFWMSSYSFLMEQNPPSTPCTPIIIPLFPHVKILVI